MKSKNILVIDDDELSNKMICSLVSKLGHKPVGKFSAKEILQNIKDYEIDAVLLDIIMPDISGVEALVEIRQHFEFAEIPVIMVTSSDKDKFIKDCFAKGANDFIAKPVMKSELEARLKGQLTFKKLTQELLKKNELESITAMIATYNHQINNPLTVVMGLLQLSKGKLSDENYEKVKHNLERISEIVKKIEGAKSRGFTKESYSQKSKIYKV